MVHFILGMDSFLALIYRNKKALTICFLFLFVFAAIRCDFGNDYNSYLNWFNYIKTTGQSPYDKEILFTYLNKICPNFSLLIMLTSGFFLIAVYHLINNNVSDDFKGLSFFIFVVNPYLFLINLSAIRQSIAIALFIFALKFATERKIIPYLILIVCAIFFHKSAILLLPFFLFANEKPVKNWHIIIICCLILFLLTSQKTLNDAIVWILDYFDDTNYNSYIFGENSVTNSVRATILSSIYLIYVLINIKNLSGKTLIYTKMYLFALIFAILAYRIPIATRLQMYFDIFSVVSLPGIIETNLKSNSNNRVQTAINVYAFPFILLLIYLLRYYSFFVNPLWERFTNYKTIFGVV